MGAREARGRAVILSPYPDPQTRLQRLLSHLRAEKFEVRVIDTAKGAARTLTENRGALQALFIEVHAHNSEEYIEGTIDQLRAVAPFVSPIVIAKQPTASQIQTCFRSGASDVIDLSREGPKEISKALDRVSRYHRSLRGETPQATQTRGLLDQFLRDLVKTERQRIDLENELRRTRRKKRQSVVSILDPDRRPVVAVVDDEKHIADYLTSTLEERGLATYAFTSGEDAVEEAGHMRIRNEPIDVALIDLHLSGINGIDTIRAMRHSMPFMAVFVMSGHPVNEIEEEGNQVGVVGYIKKPIKDLDGLSHLLLEHAISAKEQGRERHYLAEIKKRHEDVLARYKDLSDDQSNERSG